MTDFFALLRLPRRPWLNEDAVKARFLELSATKHPDKAENKLEAESGFAELNAASNILKNPRERILHLLALEGFPRGGHVQNVPPAAMELFGEVGLLLRETDSFLAGKSKASSPMMKAQLFAAGLEWTDKLQAAVGRISTRLSDLFQQIQAIDARWTSLEESDKTAALHQLEQISRALGFLERWRAQIQDRIHALAF
jgi:curved DNA-binding protein CbpA